MDKNSIDYSLYLVTDRELMTAKTLEEAVTQAILGGCGVVQLREKNCSAREFFQLAIKVKDVCRKFHVPLIINDRADIALAADCDGVHVGQSDLPADYVRKVIGENKILGVSVSSVDKAVEAKKNGADYIGVGALFPTSTKNNTNSVSPKQIAEIKKAVDIPVVAIGGIKKNNISALRGTKIDGVAVVSAVIAQNDIKKAAEELKTAWRDIND